MGVDRGRGLKPGQYVHISTIYFPFFEDFLDKKEKWEGLLDCNKPLGLFIALPLYAFGFYIVFWVLLLHYLKNLKMIQKQGDIQYWKCVRTQGGGGTSKRIGEYKGEGEVKI